MTNTHITRKNIRLSQFKKSNVYSPKFRMVNGSWSQTSNRKRSCRVLSTIKFLITTNLILENAMAEFNSLKCYLMTKKRSQLRLIDRFSTKLMDYPIREGQASLQSQNVPQFQHKTWRLKLTSA